MKLATSRLVAGALSLAVAGAATGGVIARADDSAPRAQAAQQGGVSITPARIEHIAKKGAVGTFTVKNTTRGSLRVTVTVRPWIQDRNTAGVVINKRANLTPYVRASPQTFNLAPGSRAVRLNMRRSAPNGSLYGGIQVFAKPPKPNKNGITPQWDLVGGLRLKPARPRLNLKLGTILVLGRGTGRSLVLEVRNLGNNLAPVAGTVRITGPSQRNATIPPIVNGIVPGQVVRLKGGRLGGLKAGNYTSTWSVTQGSKRYRVSRTFTYR